MGGPIVRSGASPEFSENWDRIFGGKKKVAAKPAKPAKSAKKKSATPKQAAKKTAKKKSK